MRCQYCGREAQPGQVYCECGHPVSLSQGADPRASSFGFDQPPSDYDRNWYTPDGRSLSSLEKKGMGAGGKIVIMLIVIMALAAGAFFAYKFITQSKDLLDEDNWKKQSVSKGSITLPSAMKESDNIIELNKSYSRLGFFTSDKAAVYLLEFQLTAEQKKVVKVMSQGDRKKEDAPRKRERKADNTKRYLITALADALADVSGGAVDVLNPERELTFIYNGEKFKVVLSKPREKKGE